MASQTVLLTLSGIDRPGVTSILFAALSKHPVIVLDIEQLVVRGRLVLSVLLALEPDAVNIEVVEEFKALGTMQGYLWDDSYRVTKEKC